MSATATQRPLSERTLDALRRAGNPFRNCFARNPDDEDCARYHVPELFAQERDQLLGVVELYRRDPNAHSEVIPVLGNKGAGKTHLLHSIKHGPEGAWQLIVTPGVYQKDTDFLEYLLYQIVDTLLSGGRQKGIRPLDFVGDELSRRLLGRALHEMQPAERSALFPAQGLSRWTRRLGFGGNPGHGRATWLVDALNNRPAAARNAMTVRRAITEAGLPAETACDVIAQYVERTESHNTAGLMRRAIYSGFCRAALLGDESTLASFLTHGFAELAFQVRPARQDLVLALLKVLMESFRTLKIPVVVAFDQLEDLLLSRRSDDGHRIAEAFFAGIVQTMHQIDGVCFLIFAERGLWNRFVPSLDGYIQDRLSNPVHVPGYGTIKALRLEAPMPELVRQVVEARLRPVVDDLPDPVNVSPIYPFTDEQVVRIARTEATLRDMLQQFRHLFDHLVYGDETNAELPRGEQTLGKADGPMLGDTAPSGKPLEFDDLHEEVNVKSTVVVESDDTDLPDRTAPPPMMEQFVAPTRETASDVPLSFDLLSELWDQEQRMARRRLEPEGALVGATRELQSGLGSFLQLCHEHGVKVGPWRLQHVVPEWTFGEHPAYGAMTIAHWVCKDGQPWKVGIGLFLARGAGKPRDLEIKLSALDVEPMMLDHLILLRPDDDMALTGKSKTLWTDAERRGRHPRLEPLGLDEFAVLSAFPRWLATIGDSLADGQELPNLADVIQEKCERLLEQVCMPVQG
jgi:hypothetical protein